MGRWNCSLIKADFIKILEFDKRPFRASFVASVIFDDLDRCKHDSAALVNYFKKFKTKISFLNNDKILTVGGEFCETGQMHIIVFGDYDNYKYEDGDWHMFKFRLVQTLMHELIHWSQYDVRGHGESTMLKYNSKHDEAAYYSSVDEVKAYAHCALMEIYREYPNEPIKTTLEHYCGETYEFISQKVFLDTDELILKRYKKEILRWAKLYKIK